MEEENKINKTKRLNYNKLNDHMGVMVIGFDDITQVDEVTAADLKYLINEYHLVIIKGSRKWTENEQKKFTEQLGKLELPIVHSVPPLQAMKESVSNTLKKSSGIFWHSDNSYKERPSHLSVFQMIDIPQHGTRTSFASLINLYNNLPENYKNTWSEYSVVYRENIMHPLLWKHPFNRAKTIYFDIGFSTDIIHHCVNDSTIQVKKSNKIINYINDRLSKEPSLIVHDWQVGDIIILDNYAVSHKADILLENEKRTLLRTTTEGIFF